MYTVIGTATSRAFRVLWMLEELGLEYTHLDLKPRAEDVLKYNPSGKVPVLLDNGEAITDSTAILTYLADKHSQLTFPAGTIARAKQDGMTHMVLDEIDAVLWTAARHSFILPEEHRVKEVKPSLKWEYARNVDRIMQNMKGPYLMGDTYTIADLILAHCAGWAKSAGFPTDNEVFNTYTKGIRQRAAFQRLIKK